MLPKITTAAGVDATVTLPPKNQHFLVQKLPILLCTHSYKAETQMHKWQMSKLDKNRKA